MEENGACTVVRTLLRGGVDTMFANPGTTEMLVVDALDRVMLEDDEGSSVTAKSMRGVLCLHETVCSGAADGYGRMKGRPACTLLHLGVGLANATANLHNARRACTPVINVVGDMATWHVASDPLLASDIDALAAFSSCAVLRPQRACEVAEATAEALLAVRDYRCGESRVATLALPHDVQRELGAPLDDQREAKVASLLEGAKRPTTAEGEPSLFEQSIVVHNEHFGGNDAIPKHVARCADALRSATSAMILVGGAGLHDDDALEAIGDLEKHWDLCIVVENAFARVERGAGRPDFVRAPYFPADAKRFFAKFDTIVLCGARRPVAMFGYDDNISTLLPDDEKHSVLEIDAMDVSGALRYLRDILMNDNQCSKATNQTLDGAPERRAATRPSTGRLNAHKMCQVLATTQPAGAIIVDESLTSGTAYWDQSRDCLPFTHLTLTGGSIGIGLPLAIGCAVACPDRRVVAFQADGSGLYSTPALWTMANEHLDITVLVCANHSYQILKVEQQKQKLSATAPNAKRLTSLGDPRVDWVSLAKGYGVDARAVATAEELNDALLASYQAKGPFLIEARL